ncbi:MAG: ParA family protein [Desulfurellales bacterium]|nr:MAG: ParA family protein [Desulfurellales bacterium]
MVTSKASIAIIARKGGVGKSTIAGNLAVALEQMGRSVIALDCDPQGSLAAWAEMRDPDAETPALGRIVRRLEATDLVRFRTALEKMLATVERAVIDTPPSLDKPAQTAALVADLVIVPCGPSPFDLMATRDVLEVIGEAQAQRRDKGPKIALLPSKVTRSGLGDDLPAGLRALGHAVLPAIRQRTTFARSALDGRTVLEAEPSSDAAEEVRMLARAVERMLK